MKSLPHPFHEGEDHPRWCFLEERAGIKGRKESEGVVYKLRLLLKIEKRCPLGFLRLTFLELQEDLEPGKKNAGKGQLGT